MDKRTLSEFTFHYNSETEQWNAAKDARDLFSDRSKIISAEDFDVLCEVIMKTGGDEDKIEQLLNKKT